MMVLAMDSNPLSRHDASSHPQVEAHQKRNDFRKADSFVSAGSVQVDGGGQQGRLGDEQAEENGTNRANPAPNEFLE